MQSMKRNQKDNLYTALILTFALCFALPPFSAPAHGEATITIISADGTERQLDASAEDTPVAEAPDGNTLSENSLSAGAREAFIDGIIDLAKKKYDQANGRAQRAHYKGDIYVCKNFTVYLFRENRDRFRMAEYPDVPLVIPDNKTKDACAPYGNGVEWKDIPASKGNPFNTAASFRYDTKLSKQENVENARAFLKQAKRGDFFQMTAKYGYGRGPHSMIFIADYDEVTESVHWTDSNMRTKKVNGINYGYVQYDEVKKIDFFVDAICQKNLGATLYRLRDDIIFAE